MSIELVFLFILIILNGLFSMSELAIVSSRRSRLQSMAEEGHKSAQTALDLSNDPNRFLSTVQVGITVVGTIAGVFGGATIAESLRRYVDQIPMLAPYSGAVSMGTVVVIIAYLSLVIGELVPKRLALGYPERIATLVARPLNWISYVSVPVIRLLSISTDAILFLVGSRPQNETTVTEDEIRVLIKEGTAAGIIEKEEHDIVNRVFRFGDQRANYFMTPRVDIVWIDATDPPDTIREKIMESPHSRFPVCDGSIDNVLGIVQVKDLLIQGFVGQSFDVRGLLKVPLYVPETTMGFRLLELFKTTGVHFAVLLDEYGSVQGLVTLNDLLEAILGDMPSVAEDMEPKVVVRADGSWLLDGMVTIAELPEVVAMKDLPQGDYQTLAGFVISQLGRIPKASDSFEWGSYKFEVVDMDGNRVDKVLVSRLVSPDSPA